MPKPGGCHSSGITLGDVDLALREAGRARATSPNWWNSALALNGRAGAWAEQLSVPGPSSRGRMDESGSVGSTEELS
jgi:hypothetical protein